MTPPTPSPLGFSPHLVHAPAGRDPGPEAMRAWGQVALRVQRLESGEALERLLAPWRALAALRRLRVPAAGDPEEALSVVGSGLRVDWVVDAEAAGRLRTVAPSRWRRRGVVPWAVPAPGSEVTEAVRLAGTAGWPVELPPELWTGEAPLLALLDFYLFHPGLAVPVEPFHSLLIGLLARRPQTLWELWFGSAADCFHVSARGSVSLCESWADQPSRCYGTAEQSPEVWRASGPHALLGAFLEGDAWPDPACASCGARSECGGALLALLPAARCDVFVEVMARLRLAAAALGRRSGGPTQAAGPQSCS